MTFTLPTADGGRRWFEATGEPILVGDIPSGGILTFRDITDRSLRRLQDEFLALASHELGGPLTAILGAAQLLQRKLPTDAANQAFHEYLQIIVRQVRHQKRLINDLMDMERLQHGKLHLQMMPVDMRIILAHAVEVVTLISPVPPIITAVDDGLISILGDAVRLEQILANLLSNAARYAAESPQITVRLRRLADEVELQVEDSGPGIAPEALPHLFQRFYQVTYNTRIRRQGLGLGLYVVHELVLVHQGRIEVQSVVGQGATFTMRFPLLRVAVVPHYEDATQEEAL